MDQKYLSEMKARGSVTIPDIAALVFQDRHTLPVYGALMDGKNDSSEC